MNQKQHMFNSNFVRTMTLLGGVQAVFAVLLFVSGIHENKTPQADSDGMALLANDCTQLATILNGFCLKQNASRWSHFQCPFGKRLPLHFGKIHCVTIGDRKYFLPINKKRNLWGFGAKAKTDKKEESPEEDNKSQLSSEEEGKKNQRRPKTQTNKINTNLDKLAESNQHHRNQHHIRTFQWHRCNGRGESNRWGTSSAHKPFP